ncbi:MAG: hypothetical protein HOJ48_11120 [Desulfobacula sp.]|jgi:hypothetical protein|nr:hypothetical protein [Desulfobacula sp.]
MQFLESSIFGLSAVRYLLKSPDYKVEIVLLPMVHMADKDFYHKVRKYLDECTYVLYEGVPGKKTRLLTASYSLLKFRKDLKLVSQSEYLPLDELGEKGIHADFNQEDNDRNWSLLSFSHKFIFTVFAPFYGLYRLFTASRESIAKNMSTSDLKSREEILRFDGREDMESYLMIEREKKLLQTLSNQLEKTSEGKLGILFGAGHMGTIKNYLSEHHGFKIHDSNKLFAIKL